jgi:hypothetical protein
VIRELSGKAAEQVVRVGDDAGDGSRVGAVRDVQLGRDELIGEDQAGISRRSSRRQVENRQQLRLRVGLASERNRRDRPQLGMVRPEAGTLRTAVRQRGRCRGRGGRGGCSCLTGIANAVSVAVALVGVRDRRTVIEGVRDLVAVGIFEGMDYEILLTR